MDLSSVLILIGVGVVGVVVLSLILSRLYQKASPEEALVKSGFGGRKSILAGGTFVIPVIQEVMKINMKTMRLEISRKEKDSMLTKDKLRVDVTAAFFTRVKTEEDALAIAAQTLGASTQDPDKLKELVEAKFTNALRDVAAQMTMPELQENRAKFVQAVQNSVAEDLSKNGLELEAVSLTSLDQTDKRFFNPENIFDAEGLTKITEETEKRRRERNEIQQNTDVAIKEKNLQAESLKLTIDQTQEKNRLEQQQAIQNLQAEQTANIARTQAESDRTAREAKITADLSVEKAQIEKDRNIAQAQIQKDQLLNIAEQDKKIAVSKKSQEESSAKATADEARAKAVQAEESVTTVREVAVANRKKEITVISAREAAERDAVNVTVSAEADKKAAADRAEAITIAATAAADADKTTAAGTLAKYEAEAKGQQLLNEAANLLSNEQVSLQLKKALINSLPAILEAQMKPVEKIDSIKILSMGGNGVNNTSAAGIPGSVGSGNKGVVGDLVDSLLAYRMQSPLVDNALKELGITNVSNLQDAVLLEQKNPSSSHKFPSGDTATGD